MYLGFIVGWIGLWILFGKATPSAIVIAIAVALGIALFVVSYEEPTLRQKFGTGYKEYCQNVPRWTPLPRTRRLRSSAGIEGPL